MRKRLGWEFDVGLSAAFIALGLLGLAFAAAITACSNGQPFMWQNGSGVNVNTVVTGAYGNESTCQGTASVNGVNRLVTVIAARAQAAGVDLTHSPLYQGFVLMDAQMTPTAPSIGMSANQDAVTYPKHYTPTVTLGTPQNDGTLADLNIASSSIGTIQFWMAGSVQTVSLLCTLPQ